MYTAFIASEYNPFHNGHKYLIDKTKAAGFDSVVAVMSGNFVQRGEPAVADKFFRAEAAVLGGADLVIELPLKYAVSTASYFAKGFVDTVNATGMSGAISFGASAETDELLKIKEIIFSEKCLDYTEKKIADGLSNPVAKFQFLKENYPDTDCRLLNDANNILALEYINAIDKSESSLKLFSVKRIGASHDSDVTTGEYSSAGYIRRKLSEASSFDAVRMFMPNDVFDLYKEGYNDGSLPVDMKAFDVASFSRLISFDAEYFRNINNVTGGIENRIEEAIKKSNDLSVLYDNIKSRHYTHSRIRQIILSAVLGIKKSDLDRGVSYIRVLAFNDKGREILHQMKKSASIPVISNLSKVNETNSESIITDAKLDYNAGKLYNLLLSSQRFLNPEYDNHPVYVKNSST